MAQIGQHFQRLGRRWSKLVTTIVVLAVLTSTLLWYKEDVRELPDRVHIPFLSPGPKAKHLKTPMDIFVKNPEYITKHHPIDDLVRIANEDFDKLIRKQPDSVSAAAKAYRERRGRHPPPHFDKWYEFATARDCLIIEDFFDRIHKDIEPFWARPALEIRNEAKSLPPFIRIRNGKVESEENQWHFFNYYVAMLKEIEEFLPDADLPINVMDESRLIVPWEDVNALINRSVATKNTQNPPTKSTFDVIEDNEPIEFDAEWKWEGPYWNLARDGCSPDSFARSADLDPDFSVPFEFPKTWPPASYQGFVHNWTLAKDPCFNAHLRNMHGSFVEPISQSTSRKMIPMFGGSKLPFNNEILFPAAVYWLGDERFTMDQARLPWSDKRTEVLWRGIASGGRNKDTNWKRFHRHRIMSMLNGTQIDLTLKALEDDREALAHPSDDGEDPPTHFYEKVPGNFPLPDQSLYHLESFAQGVLPEWISSFSNTGFTRLVCFPETKPFSCPYTGAWYSQATQMQLYRMFKAKYLPDVDGNSFSGRWRSFLQSNSLAIKATIYDEWHDDRMLAWKHFVPMDNTFMDLWAILEYFVGHDNVAEKVALEGGDWGRRVLRKEDMLAYVYRVILEYARVSSDARETMGWEPDEYLKSLAQNHTAPRQGK